MSPWRARYPLLFVTVTGAAVMGLEILGTRVIGTVYGSSLFVWGALITTTLVCLSAGYALGGVLADRWPKEPVLYGLTVLAGAAALAIPAAQGILEPCLLRFGPRAGALASAFAIFAAPLVLLGMASPYVIRLLIGRIESAGRTAGAVFALSTAGSVAGTLLTSLFLVPALGTRASLAVLAAAVILVGAGGLALASKARGAGALALAMLAWPVARGGPAPDAQVLYRGESPYGRLAVVQPAATDRGGYRLLFNNGIIQTGMPLDIDRRGRTSLLRADSYYLELLPYFHDEPDEPRKALLIGLAGGLFARVMSLYPIDLTAVEIDVRIAELAKAYFGCPGRVCYPDGRHHVLDVDRYAGRAWPAMSDDEPPAGESDSGPAPGGTRIIIQDGRRFLHACRERYDFIVLDAYSGDTIPFHLITREMFQSVRQHLADDGILAINYIGSPRGDGVTESLARTLREVFGRGQVWAYRSTDDTEAVQVIYFLAFRGRPREPSLPASRWAPAGGIDPLAHELLSRRLDLDAAAGIVITDDYNPIDAARVRTALAWRTQTLSSFGRLNLHRF